MVGSLLVPEEAPGMTMARYCIYELDSADLIVNGYSVMCRSDAAALAMASGAGNRAAAVAAVEVWESRRCVARLDPVTPWDRFRSQWSGQPAAPPARTSGRRRQ